MKRYNIIYADPPWRYRNYNYAFTKGGKRAKRGIPKEYNNLSVEDLCALPIKNLSAENCILFIWVVFPLLKEAFQVIEAWGFDYKTLGFNWVKKNKIKDSWVWGMGFYTRSNSEICLIGTKGGNKRIDAGVHSVIDSKIRGASQKPDEARNRITKLMGDLPRIELFARKKFVGWDVWGDEVENDINMGDYSFSYKE